MTEKVLVNACCWVCDRFNRWELECLDGLDGGESVIRKAPAKAIYMPRGCCEVNMKLKKRWGE